MKPIIYATTTMLGIVCLHRAFPLVQQSLPVAPFTEPVAESQDAAYGITPQPVQVNRVVWHDDYESAKQDAITNHRPLLVRWTAPWCGPCQTLKAKSKEGRLIQRLERFTCLLVDIDQHPEWKVTRIPLEAIYDPTTMRPLRPAYNPLTVGDYAAFLEAQ